MEAVEVWRAGDVAALYGVDESTVHRWERSGRLRPARRDPGGAKYWLRDELVGDLTAEPQPRAEAQRATTTLVVAELAAATRRSRRRKAG